MSDYEYTHEYSKLERTECEECGHAHWRERYEPIVGCKTKEQHEWDEEHRRFAGMFAGPLREMSANLNRKLFAPPVDFANITKERALTGLAGWLPANAKTTDDPGSKYRLLGIDFAKDSAQ